MQGAGRTEATRAESRTGGIDQRQVIDPPVDEDNIREAVGLKRFSQANPGELSDQLNVRNERYQRRTRVPKSITGSTASQRRNAQLATHSRADWPTTSGLRTGASDQYALRQEVLNPSRTFSQVTGNERFNRRDHDTEARKGGTAVQNRHANDPEQACLLWTGPR